MTSQNPYAAGGWPNPGNPNSINNVPWSPSAPPQPSVYGALPLSVPPRTVVFQSFTFTSFSPDILNCSVLGPQARPYFRVITDTPTPGFTLIYHYNRGPAVTVTQWSPHAVVEVRDIVKKQRASQWLALAPDGRSRMMEVRGRRYVWMPQADLICLYTATMGSTPPTLMGRISRGNRTVTLELTSDAIQIGLLEASVLATTLLLSGRIID
ncbi:hypothetical protein FISHEDRAFT_41131 [Fistulina hepatica ATCC 64428]|nr:hypothetical protein FISHEDRAFT_41131 [Fistulina hepatica ATCC 64428]